MEEKKPPIFEGFNRVIINYEGDAVPMKAALTMYAINPTVGFMRKDGWSLGSTKEMKDVAYNMWPDEWVYQIEYPKKEWEKLK